MVCTWHPSLSTGHQLNEGGVIPTVFHIHWLPGNTAWCVPAHCSFTGGISLSPLYINWTLAIVGWFVANTNVFFLLSDHGAWCVPGTPLYLLAAANGG